MADRLGEVACGPAGRRCLGLAHGRDGSAVALRVGRVLVVGEERRRGARPARPASAVRGRSGSAARTSASTAAGSCAARRPQRKARRLNATCDAVAARSPARSPRRRAGSALSAKRSRPGTGWRAIASPDEPRGEPRQRRRRSTLASPAASTIARRSRSAGKARSGLRVKSPVIAASVLTMTAVRPCRMLGSAVRPAATTRSQPSTQRGSAGRHARAADLRPAVGAILMWLRTAPPFCASPTMSSVTDALALEVRRHAEQGRDRDHAGAADAGDDDAVRAVERRQRSARAAPGTARPRGRPSPCAACRP